MLTAERLSDLIGTIYDCVLDPTQWPAALTAIRDEFRFANCVISVHDLASAAMKIHVTVGLDDDMVQKGPQYAAAVADLWGGPSRVMSFPLEEPILQSEATPRSTWMANAYYRDLLLPRGLHDCISAVLVKDRKTHGIMGLGQHRDNGEVQDATMTALRLITPHLRRAVVIGRLFEQETMFASTFSDVLDGMIAGALLVDKDMSIVHANASARAMLDEGVSIRSRNGKLSLANSLTEPVLTDAVSQAAEHEAALERRSIDIPVLRSDNMPAVLQVLPLKRRSGIYGLEARAVAAVFISDNADPSTVSSAALALLYNLSPAETRVFELVVQGKNPAELSRHLGISMSTVRTHLSRVFEKTGCDRQAELVRLASRMSRIV